MKLKDSRVPGRCLYPLIDIIGITLCLLICGVENRKAIELYGHQRKRFLSRFFNLSNGIPSHLTFARVFSLLDPEQFKKCIMDWINEVCQLINDDIIAIDGKKVRGSSHINGAKAALHIINAFAARQKITLAQVKTPDKSNEIKGIPQLLNLINLKNMIITIDAMGTQKGIAKLIRKKQAHYVLALKKNHQRFYKKVHRLFERADELNYKEMVYKQWADKNYGHGRIEEREYTVLPLMYLHSFKKQWADLSLFVRVYIDWDREAPVTSLEQLFFIEFLKCTTLFDQ